MFDSIDAVTHALRQTGYIADRALATTVFLAGRLGKPILAEGPAGVGKTELAKAVASALGTDLIRLQCYEGLDEAKTLYEWKYAKQLLYTQLLRDHIDAVIGGATSLADAVERIASEQDAFFSDRFLQERPLLQAIRADRQTVLLIDEVDRAEDELEAFFLEVLAEFQVTVPELGTLRARHRPFVVLTSNNTRELSDALRRRCLHLWMDYPSAAREAEILQARVPEIGAQLAGQVADFVHKLRALDLKKAPSISETIDWARALTVLATEQLGEDVVRDTLNVLLKYEGDREAAEEKLGSMLE
ncbi:MAG: MoxR family ATPase [Deltaproteobacteria bacterium]|nr:MAG: MoxR family ATPase [Deltaproteobacteria bacterium]